MTLSEDMKETLCRRGVDSEKVFVINNPPVGGTVDSGVPLPDGFPTERPVILFAGNHGSFQGLDKLVEAARCLPKESEVAFVFIGEGASKKSLIEQAGDLVGSRVFFLEQQSVETAHRAMAEAMMGVVSLMPGVYKVAYPSKTMNYFSAGCPVLALVEPESCLSRTLKESGTGVSVWGKSPEKIAQAVCDFESNVWKVGTETFTLRVNQFFEKHFSAQVVFSKWGQIFTQMKHEEHLSKRQQDKI